jgi:hypothetical protein
MMAKRLLDSCGIRTWLPYAVGLVLVVFSTEALAQSTVDFTRLQVEVESAKTQFLTIAKVIVGLIVTILVVFGIVATIKQLMAKDHGAMWQLLYTAAGVGLGVIALAVF